MSSPTEVAALQQRIHTLEAATAAARSDVRFLAAMEQVSRRMRGASNLEQLLESALDELLDLFACDRAWLLYPCDPAAESWSVPMERARPEWPGAFALGVTVPMDDGAAAVFETALDEGEPVPYDETTDRSVPEDVHVAFGIRAQLVVAIHPHNDKPWLLGIHHCADDHVFGPDELRIFAGLGQRIGEALDSMLLLRDLRESERGVAQLQRMQAIGSLAGGVAHDFNNQLLVIVCYADLLRGSLGAGAAEYLDHVLRAGERAAKLTRQLLAFSRRSVLEPRPVDLGAMVEEGIEFLGRAVGSTIVVDFVPSPAAVARVDPAQIEQVLVNLVTNARDAMPAGGTIRISSGRRSFGADDVARPGELDPGAYAFIEVADDGTGMDGATMARVFEPFFTTKEHGKGTGFGLSTAYGVARQSGGTLTVESTVGQGSTFRVWLPESPDEEVASSGRFAPVGVGGSERILMVDDLEEVADIAIRVLGREGYRVTALSHPSAALEAIEAADLPFDLLLTDVVMAGMDGVELARRAVEIQPSLKVSFSTGYSTQAVERLREAAATRRILQKPYLPAQLLAHVRAALDA